MFVFDPRRSLTVDQLYGSQQVYELISAAYDRQRAGDFDGAIDSASQAAAICELSQHRARCERVLAVLHYATGQYEACETESLAVAQALPGECDDNYHLAYEARLARAGVQSAREVADMAVSSRFGDPSLRAYARARALQRWGHPSEALAEVNDAIAGWPHGRSEFLSLRAQLHVALGNDSEGEADAERALAIDPSNLEPRIVRAGIRHARADFAGAIDDCSQAVDACIRQLHTHPNEEARWTIFLADAYALRARARLGLNRVDDAAEDAMAATARNPTVLEHWLTRIEAEAAAGGIGDVLETAELAAFTQSYGRDRASVHTLVARLQCQRGDFAGALDACERALEAASDFAPAYRQRAQVWRGLGDDGRARRDEARANELDGAR